MRKDLALSKNMSSSQKRKNAPRAIALRMIDIMQNHIGMENSITRPDLFYKIFDMRYSEERLDHWMLWEFTKRAMHLLRRNSNCFISMNFKESVREYVYFVVKDNVDAQSYINILENNMKRMISMQFRARRAVQEKWHEQVWVIDYEKKNKQLEGEQKWKITNLLKLGKESGKE